MTAVDERVDLSTLPSLDDILGCGFNRATCEAPATHLGVHPCGHNIPLCDEHAARAVFLLANRASLHCGICHEVFPIEVLSVVPL